MIILDKRDNMH